MKIRFNKIRLLIAVLASIAVFSLGSAALALSGIDPGKVDLQKNDDAFQQSAGFSQATQDTLGENLAVVIKSFLSLLGVIFIIYIIYAGYNYLTAAGDNQKVEKAVTTIQRAIIGLIIVVSAYAITAYVFKSLPPSAGGSSTVVGGS